MVVDLPAPFGPRNPVTVPGAIVKLRECTAVVSPQRSVSTRASIVTGTVLGRGWDGVLNSER
jgi:hypothetical protein